jgi:aminoglycoside 2''-phosphotransferase
MLESINDEKTVETLVSQIISFLYALHHMPLADLDHVRLPVTHERKRYESLYTRVRIDLFPHLEPELCDHIAANFKQFLDTPQNFALTPVLIHGSFGPQRILYDAKTRSISGIIGFTQAGLGDPACDIAALLGPQGYGKNLLQHLEHFYPDLPYLWERIQFYANVSILQKILSQSSQQNSIDIAHKRELLSLMMFSTAD